MATSILDIYNMALPRVGNTSIRSLSERRPNADICNEFWGNVRDEMLASSPWNCAVKRVALTRLSGTPAYGYEYSLALPNDCLRILSEYEDKEFNVEGRVVLSDYDSLNVRYIARIEDVNAMSPHLQKCMWMSLAAAIAFAKASAGNVRREIVEELYNIVLPDARTIDSSEGYRSTDLNTDYTDPFTTYMGA